MPAPLPAGRPIRWGILGAGGIADTVAGDIALSDDNVVTAVAARDAHRAAAFAAKHGFEHGYGDYRALVADDDVDVVYLATTHPSHHDLALMAIDAGKAVLIEKPLCLNAAEARDVFAAAERAGVFAMEAMWMRTNPLIRTARQLIADGAIGELRGLRAEFAIGVPFDPRSRLYDIDNGGGGLLDLGVYPATFAHLFLGHPDEVMTAGTLAAGEPTTRWPCSGSTTVCPRPNCGCRSPPPRRTRPRSSAPRGGSRCSRPPCAPAASSCAAPTAGNAPSTTRSPARAPDTSRRSKRSPAACAPANRRAR